MEEIEKILQSLECPFTWSMDEIDVSKDCEYNEFEQYQFFPIVELMHHVMAVYISLKKGDEYHLISSKLEKCQKAMEVFKQDAHKEISIAAVESVVESTKAHILYKFEKFDELDLILERLKDVDIRHEKYRSTINSCKSISWSKHDVHKAIYFIREAIQGNKNCDFYYFTLGKELRRIRRDEKPSSSSMLRPPSEEENNCLRKSYEIFNNPYCGIFLAQLYRENRDRIMAEKVYNSIFNANPESSIILLRLALGFIHYKAFEKAKICLDKVAVMCPKHELYLHYKGMFYMNQKQFREAIPLLEEAIKVARDKCSQNSAIIKQYLQCKTFIDSSFDVTKYLLGIIEEYKNLPLPELQHFYLELAFSYWKYKKNIPKAAEIFIDAIEMNPKAEMLMNYRTNISIPIYAKDKNIFWNLQKNLLPIMDDSQLRERLRTILIENSY